MRNKRYAARLCAALLSGILTLGSALPVWAEGAGESEAFIEVQEEDSEEVLNIAEDSSTEADALFTDGEDTGTGTGTGTGTETNTETETETTTKGVTAVSGQLYASGYSSPWRDAAITTDTVTENSITWTLINLTFEMDDFNQAGKTQAWVHLRFTSPATGESAVGTLDMAYAYNEVSQSLYNSCFTYSSDSDYWYSSIATLNMNAAPTAEKSTRKIYVIYTNGDQKEYYKICLVRKGAAGLKSQPRYSASNPITTGIDWVYDEENDLYMATKAELEKLIQGNKVEVTNQNGSVCGTLAWTNVISTDPSADLYQDDECIYVKKAGQYKVYTASWGGMDYEADLRFTYSYAITGSETISRAQEALNGLKTDGITSLDSFADADAFAAVFPENFQTQAKSYYESVMSLQQVLTNTIYGGAKRGEWDYSIYNNTSWKDTCESAQVDALKEQKETIWGNIYGQRSEEKTTVTPTPTPTAAPTAAPVVTEPLTLSKTSYTKTEGNAAFTLGIKKNTTASVSYASGNKSVVTVDKNGQVTIKGCGRTVITVTAKNGAGVTKTYKVTVTVKPSAKLSPSAKSKSAKTLLVSWKRNTKASGYQVIVARDKSFKKTVKKVTVKTNKTIKATIKGLKGGKKYYVRVRSYKKATGGTIYGSWAKAKAVTVKAAK